MKKISFICLLSFLQAAFSVQAQSLLPTTVQQFLEEQRYSAAYKQNLNADGIYSRFVSPRVEDDGIQVIDAFIALDDERIIHQLERLGVRINCVFDGFVTAQIPLNHLEAVSMIRGVKDVEISRRIDLCTDSTMHATGVDYLMNGLSWGLPANYDGSGVIVGVIDLGFDFQHRAFRSNDNPSLTRIVRVYNTQVKTGHKAYYNQHYQLPGSVFMNDEIYSLTTDMNSNTHGTHTASIAAGSHVNGYGGMAPGADIVMCAVSSIEGGVSAVEIANCVRYIDSYADSVGQPCVISLSVNTSIGQHDGMDYLSKIVKQTMGPGRIFVIAAGNNSGTIPYAHYEATPAKPMNLMFKCANNVAGDSTFYYRNMTADVWMRKTNTTFYFKFHVIDLNKGTIVWESEQLSGKVRINADQLSGYYKCYTAVDTASFITGETTYDSQSKKYRLEIQLHNLMSQKYSLVNDLKKSRYALGVTVYPRKNISSEIDAWTGSSTSRFGSYKNVVTGIDGSVRSDFYAAPSDSCCIGTYAVGDSTISAGAYSARNSYYSLRNHRVVTESAYTIGEIAAFSAYQVKDAGPTGEALPTICAPGTCVVAAASRYSYLANSVNTVMTSDGSYWGTMSGTSMAAPTVAGVIALWLQANPRLSVKRVKEILASTATSDRFTNGPKHNQFGPNGKINAYEGMMLALRGQNWIKTGDVNNDGKINIIDVMTLINYLLSNNASDINIYAADIDGDGRVDIYDATCLISMLLEH